MRSFCDIFLDAIQFLDINCSAQCKVRPSAFRSMLIEASRKIRWSHRRERHRSLPEELHTTIITGKWHNPEVGTSAHELECEIVCMHTWTHTCTHARKHPVQTCYVAPNRGSVKQICVYGTVQSGFRRDQRISFKWRELFRVRGNIKKTLAMISRCETSRCDAPTNVLGPDIIKQNKIRIMNYDLCQCNDVPARCNNEIARDQSSNDRYFIIFEEFWSLIVSIIY